MGTINSNLYKGTKLKHKVTGNKYKVKWVGLHEGEYCAHIEDKYKYNLIINVYKEQDNYTTLSHKNTYYFVNSFDDIINLTNNNSLYGYDNDTGNTFPAIFRKRCDRFEHMPISSILKDTKSRKEYGKWITKSKKVKG